MTHKIRKLMLGLVSLAVLCAGPAYAVPIELALVVDSSGSINSTEWTTQTQGYANAISNVMPTDGSVAVSVTRFATDATVVRGMTTIGSASDRDALSNFFLSLSQSGNGSNTCISCGIELAEGTLTGTADKSLIDVSTDGMWNRGTDPDGGAATTGTAEWAVANDADTVNTLGVGTGSIPDFYHGTDSFGLLAADFDDFEDVLTQKLQREIGVPEPATLALMGVGLLGMGFSRKVIKTTKG